jgi:hypothetical protein
MPYPWYAIVTGPTLQQGDLLRDCLAPLPPRPADLTTPNLGTAPEPSGIYDRVVILSQSCDLADAQIRYVMVCPAYTVDQFLSVVGGNRDKQRSAKDNLIKGRYTAYHLLNKCELAGYEAPHLVADFGEAFSIPFEYALELVGTTERLRLLPPYREQLAQMFARFYMRVGLPVEVAPLP